MGGNRAAAWTPIGLTKGFQRHRAPYFRKHGRPKKLWLKRLNRNAMRILIARDMPRAYEPALNRDPPERDLALKKRQMQDLRTHFQEHFSQRI